MKLNPPVEPRAKPLDVATVTRLAGGKKQLLLTAGGAGGALTLVLLGLAWWEFAKR